MKPKKKILYFYPQPSTFILKDVEILSTEYNVKQYLFSVKNKYKVPLEFIKQFFFLLINIWKTDVLICHFAGYSSFLPALFAKLTRKSCFIIVAGNDGSKFPDFGYGNYTKKLLGFFTGISLQMSKHILPVHESLVYQKYDYYEGGMPAQGYSYFKPKTKNIPFTALYYGYDSEKFRLIEGTLRIPNSFITIGNLGDNYAFKRKGFDLIIELAKLRPELNFTFIGWDGIKKIDLPQNVTLLKFMDQEEIIKIFNTHEFYFQLSIMEGFPNALAEAMLCGCIPIGSNVSGIPYIIDDTGFILKQRDIQQLCDLVDEALKSKVKLQLSSNARLRVLNNFSMENRLKGFSQVIQKYE